jgi:FKBP-type peptidyl-prolyl cis-trans isomerase
MFSKFELIGAGVCIALMALAIYLVQLQTAFDDMSSLQPAAVVESRVVVVSQTGDGQQAQADALLEASDSRGNLNRMVINDITIGTGPIVQTGDTVRVHYAGRLQDGTEFDNSRKRGEPLEFTVGAGRVISGWEEGLIGMQMGGERILVIPPDKAYGDRGVGPIPGGATLIFSIELEGIN